MSTHYIRCLSTALSPLTHMARTEGNEAVIQREPVVTPAGVRYLPCLSGNALRHKLLRAPGARFLVERYDLRGKLSQRQLNFLFHGGNLTESTARVDTAGHIEFYRLFPLYRAIGGSLPNAILPGSADCGRGVLVCRENAARLRSMIPFDVPANLRPAEAFVEGYQYTRGDVRNSARDLARREEGEEISSNLMIFAGQSVITGAIFAHEIILKHASDLELGAVLLSIALWQSQGATIGGQSSRGHGKLDTLISLSVDADAADLMHQYVAHVDAMRGPAIAMLDTIFAPPMEDKPKRGKKGRPIEAA